MATMRTEIKTADDYFKMVSTFDQRQVDEAIARIPMNINRAGKLYPKIVKKIYADYAVIRNARATKGTATATT